MRSSMLRQNLESVFDVFDTVLPRLLGILRAVSALHVI